MNEVTRIIHAIEQGEAQAAEKLLPLVYEELRVLAARKMAQERPGQTLQATALVHEAYIRLVEGADQKWSSKGYFFKAAAEAMRRILIEKARKKKSLKQGGGHIKVKLEGKAATVEEKSDDLIALDEALAQLKAEDSLKAQLVKLRFFAGLSIDQAAEVLEISRATAIRHWSFARAWLFHNIHKDS